MVATALTQNQLAELRGRDKYSIGEVDLLFGEIDRLHHENQILSAATVFATERADEFRAAQRLALQ